MEKKTFELIVEEVIGQEYDQNGTSNYIKVLAKTKNNLSKTLHLSGIWTEAEQYLWTGAKINIYYAKEEYDHIAVGPFSYLVLEPDILVNPSSIRTADGCIRKYYVNRRTRLTDKNTAMLLGSLINNAFDIVIEKKDEEVNKEEIINQVLKNSISEIAGLKDYEENTLTRIKNELSNNLEALSVWKTHQNFSKAEEITTEPSFISNKYGLSGRLDLLVNPGKNAVTYELKTSKPPTGNPWPSDTYQVACYQLLLESAYDCNNPLSYLIYSKASGNNLLKNCSVDTLKRRSVINMRNKIISIDYALLHDYRQNYLKSFIPMTEKGNCEKCFLRKDCFEICANLNEKNCPTCGVQKLCSFYDPDKNTDLEFYHTFFRLIESERNESRKLFSRIFTEPESIIKEGKMISELYFEKLEERKLTLTSEKIIEAEIKPGDVILLYSQDINRGEVFKASIKEIDRYSLVINLKKDLKPEFFQDKLWNVYTDTMETSFDTQQGALYKLLKDENKFKRDLITGRVKPKFKIYEEIELDKSLNESQKEAIRKALSAENYFLIQGPPGTGKTHTLAKLIIELVKKGNRVLLSAFTHRSIDNVLLKLLENEFHDFIRIGSHEITIPEVHPYLLQEKIKDYEFEEVDKIRDFIKQSKVVACTSSGAMTSDVVKNLNFDFAVIDEAGQLTQPGAICVILNAEKFILVGDHKQLPPVVQSDNAKEKLSESLFERLIDLNRENISDVMVTLDEQYRMNEAIMDYPNQNFYNFMLKAHESNSEHILKLEKDHLESEYSEIINPNNKMVFINFESRSTFKVNQKQAEFINMLVQEFVEHGLAPEKIGVITPFRAQVAEIRRGIISLPEKYQNITIDTVDRFQGSDRDLIIFSSVVSDEEQVTDFFSDFRRINVSITRAKKKFILVGDKEVLSASELFYKLIRSSKQVFL